MLNFANVLPRSINLPAMVVLASITTTTAIAQDNQPADAPIASPNEAAQPVSQEIIPHDQGTLRFSFNAGGSYLSRSEIDEGGDFSASRFGSSVGGAWQATEKLQLNFKLGYERHEFRFSNATALGGEPWENVNILAAQLGVGYQLDDQWTLFAGPIVSIAAEDAASWNNAITAGVAAGANYRLNDKLDLGFGLGVTTRLEESMAVFPILRFNWKMTDTLTLRSGTFDLGVQGGAGGELAWQAHESLELALGAQYQSRRFRLDNRNIAPDGVGQESGVPVYLRAIWQPDPRIVLSGHAGVLLAGRLEVEDEDGRHLGDRKFDPAPFVGGRVTLRF